MPTETPPDKKLPLANGQPNCYIHLANMPSLLSQHLTSPAIVAQEEPARLDSTARGPLVCPRHRSSQPRPPHISTESLIGSHLYLAVIPGHGCGAHHGDACRKKAPVLICDIQFARQTSFVVIRSVRHVTSAAGSGAGGGGRSGRLHPFMRAGSSWPGWDISQPVERLSGNTCFSMPC